MSTYTHTVNHARHFTRQVRWTGVHEMAEDRVIVVGAGIAGLSAALTLAARGAAVTVIERAPAPGGKMRQITIGPARIDSGPTVFTMRWVFDELFAEIGASLDDHLTLTPLDVLARHAWTDRRTLDLFADEDRSADAIGQFAGRSEAEGYRAFCRDARRIFEVLRDPFIRTPTPSMTHLLRSAGFRDLTAIRPFQTLWKALGGYFRDARLQQLFGRYATYCGSSPFHAPATLMLVAHVEQAGVWLIDGGMHELAACLAALARRHGVTIRYGAEVAAVVSQAGRATGVRLADGEQIAADAIVATADVGALAQGLFGAEAARALPSIPESARSLSAMTWSCLARADGFPLVRHNVFFSRDYGAEFNQLIDRRAMPQEPTVYVCAQDRDDRPRDAGTNEPLFVLINAPATGDRHSFAPSEISQCARQTFDLLQRCGLSIATTPELTRVTTPTDFNRMFPGAGGALYGRSSHGWMASFQRPGAQTKLPGLYVAGGSAHPGPGVPMAALSGRMAANRAIADLASTAPSRRTAMRGGMSTR
ncbi:MULTISPECIES: 1-hydroxycarotenoid 3,4-desaturase CrtD [unclassified Bradyrhizobium]|uniref:1-hydroxycarotenoid 3,4-desaturase CrtD n=1 Tax=unclassified Bradyrhizobium TaxID=2631580 RepID=UPI0028E97607|nr:MULTISPECIES: 1-hydroxycarotenoid 3,4-desaturase CrtD [unclassified Bradyrhizobium]